MLVGSRATAYNRRTGGVTVRAGSELPMEAILNQLYEDHAHVEVLLDHLERQLHVMRDDGATDLRLMTGVLHYLTHYGDHFHHPRENLVFERVAAREAGARPVVERLGREHGELGVIGQRLATRLAAPSAAADVPEILAEGQAYVGLQRDHMRAEEREVFPLAGIILPHDDWERIRVAMKMRADPLFGSVVEQAYQHLYDVMQGKPR